MIVLPWKVLVADNARHGLSKGRIILTERYRMALSAAALLASQQWTAQRRERLRDKVQLSVTLHEPDKRRRDISNYLKLIQDSLTCTAFADDSQIDRVTVKRGGLDRYNPRAEIEVTDLAPASPPRSDQ